MIEYRDGHDVDLEVERGPDTAERVRGHARVCNSDSCAEAASFATDRTSR